jgi:hypothetical protein
VILAFAVGFGLIFMGLEELGWKWALILLAACGAMTAGYFLWEMGSFYLVAAQSFIDIVLVLVLFGGDINISG